MLRYPVNLIMKSRFIVSVVNCMRSRADSPTSNMPTEALSSPRLLVSLRANPHLEDQGRREKLMACYYC